MASTEGLTSNPFLIRFIGWTNLFAMTAFLLNTFLTFWLGFPGASFSSALGICQVGLYILAPVAAFLLIKNRTNSTLRSDSFTISNINTYFIRSLFWAVLLMGVVDGVISFLRVEGLLEPLFGEEMTKSLGRSHFRGAFIHMPLLAAGFLIALRSRTLGFHWLALLIVIAELLIVIFRFIFSYEQAFMADLLRFWYGALFLFASAYTLLEEGHVRVDIFYAGLKDRTKGFINAIGSLVLGVTFCWTILYFGMGQKSSIIVSPFLNFETTQSGFGLYLKYMMAVFLGVFAVSMMIQFVSYLMGAVADYRGEEGKYQPQLPGGH